MEEEEKLRKELQELKKEHTKLDKRIELISKSSVYDQLLLQRLKRRKLKVKDRISIINSILYDDIIA